MSVKDMIKKSVLESGVFDQYNISSILVALVAALALGILIFLVYSCLLYTSPSPRDTR